MNRYKTPEEIERERLLREERYPETVNSNFDPTAALRKKLMSGSSDLFKKSPLYKSLFPDQKGMANLPEDYNELAQQEALDQSGSVLPANYNELAQQEAEENNAEYNLSPEAMNYAYEIFPSLNQIVPNKNVQVPLKIGEINTPMAPFTKEPSIEPTTAPQATPQATPQASPKTTTKAMERSIAESIPQTEVPTEKALKAPSQPSIDDIIKKAQEDEDSAFLMKQAAKFRDAVMGAGSGTMLKTDTSLYDELASRAQRPLKNLLLSQELKDKKEKNDPNSEISKLAKKALTDLGMNLSEFKNVSYAQLEKLYPSLTNAIATKIAAQAKKEEVQLRKIESYAKALENKKAKQEKADEKFTALQDKRLNELAKRSDNILKSEEYKLYNQTKPTMALLDEAIRRWKTSNKSYKEFAQASFMGYAKAAQQDSSVVRESDMRVLAGGVNFGSLGGLINKLLAKKEGAEFSPQELEEFKAVINTIQEIKRKDLAQRFDPIFKRAADVDIPEDYFLSPEIIEDIRSAKSKKSELTPQERLAKLEEMAAKNQSRMDELKNKQGQ
jgi:hypothetical protein